MLFTKSKDEIMFADVEEFCREFGEGVRVEYKREIKHIPKIVSSFANTHGGVIMIIYTTPILQISSTYGCVSGSATSIPNCSRVC